MLIRTLWLLGGGIAVAVGVLGIFAPMLPGVPFLLLAAFCFARGSATAHRWLVGHPRLGPPIRQWQEHRAISRRTKRVVTVMLVATLAVAAWLGVGGWLLAGHAILLTAVAMFIWHCSDPPA
ncbi:MAG: YbaN family protein [Gammaproteobacteria bacterium]